MSHIVISGRAFSTPKLVLEEARRIRNVCSLGAALKPEDQAFVWELFRQFPPRNVSHSALSGVVRTIRVFRSLHGRYFEVAFADGRTIYPSLSAAFRSEPSRSSKARGAMLRVSLVERVQYRERYFAEKANAEGYAPCELTGALVSHRVGSCVAVYAPPQTFRPILDDYLMYRSLTLVDIETVRGRDGFALADKHLADDWQRYHRQRAKLLVVSQEVYEGMLRAPSVASKESHAGAP